MWQTFSLKKEIFDYLIQKLGKPKIYLFFSRQLDMYVSWKPDQDAFCTDAFSMSWSNKYCYLFPSLSLISRCVWKLRKDRA